ncbi:MAG: hypothetical protein IJ601_04075 [Acidaminococcaceae bacterium]|nr:hypothetical protein [Acidaminococcaceae bacterium]
MFRSKQHYRKPAIIVLIIVLYFLFLTWVSFLRAPSEARAVISGDVIAEYKDFINLDEGSGAGVEEDKLVFGTGDSPASVFGARVPLADSQGIEVSFTVDCPAEYAGSVVHVDLFDGAGYDFEEQEFQITLLEGLNEIEQSLYKGANAPEEAWLRIFILENAEIEMRRLKLHELKENDRHIVLYAAAIVDILILALIVIGSMKKKVGAENVLKYMEP